MGFRVAIGAFLLWWAFTFTYALFALDIWVFFFCVGVLALLQLLCWCFLLQERHPVPSRVPQVLPTAAQRRLAHRCENGGCYTTAEWDALCRAYQGRCACCGTRAKLTKDHVLPLSKGGTDDIDNLQPLCRSCNSRKGVQHIDYRKEARRVQSA